MWQLISWFLAGVISLSTGYYVFNQCLGEKKAHIDIRTIIWILFFAIINAYSIVFLKPIIKMVVTSFSLLIFFRLIFHQGFSKTFILMALYYIANGIGEVVVGIFLTVLFHIIPISYFRENILGIISANIIISILVIVIYKMPNMLKFIRNISYWYESSGTLNEVLITLTGVASITLLLYQNFTIAQQDVTVVIDCILIAGIILFLVNLLHEKTNNAKLMNEYDKLLEYVTTFEAVFESGQKERHEYKNQLILISNMIGEKGTKAKNYIDKILNKVEPMKCDSQWLLKLQNIPSASIRGFIYYKILTMEQIGLNIYVEVKNEVKDATVKRIIDQELQDISRILGVYIDNAMEASSQSDQKYVIIEARYQNEIIIFGISNTYMGTIDISNMDKAGYTTKGKGKGYGLSLVTDIISRNKILSQKRIINGSYFVQELMIENK